MLRDIDYLAFSSQQDMNVAGAARQAWADVVIVMVAADQHVDWQALLFSRPKMKVFAIDADGRRGVLHELRPFETGFDGRRCASGKTLSPRRTRGGMDFVR